uniref:Stage III sporulation protein AB n=1 Tax=Eubacterium plexicaudatum ASF492 TaxID=1235802 RepID=N2A3Q5_9FIRM
MLKLIGCICILAASSGMAYSCTVGLQVRLRQTELLSELLTAIEGELTYSRCPLPELLIHLSQHMKEPYADLLLQVSSQMEENREADIPVLWKEACTRFRRQMNLPSEVYESLLRVGEVFSYSSLDSSLQLLEYTKKKLDAAIRSQYAEFAGKRKLYCCLCYTAGLFSIIILL